MEKSAILIILLLTLNLSGCSTAGPFVTNISSDGKGGLIIEKQKVQYNYLLGVVSNEGSSTTEIKVVSENK